MKILLCTQCFGNCKPIGGTKIAFPLGLSCIASMISDHELSVFDANLAHNPLDELRAIIEKVDPDVVAISLRNIDGQLSSNVCSYYEPFVSMLKIIKTAAPTCKLIVGGTGFTVFPEEIMRRNPEIDFGVVSNGEFAIVDLLKNFDYPEKVKNLFFRRDSEIHFTGTGVPVDLDSLPSPLWDAFDMDTYSRFPFSVGIEAKRGCAFNCIHCLYSCLQGKRVLVRSPKMVVDEIEKLVNNYGISSFFFVDPIFNFPLEHGRKVCQEIMKRNLDVKWRAWFQSDNMNRRFMVDAVKTGCDIFDFSPDGASNEALKVLGKNLTIKDVEKSIRLVGEIDGARVGYNFMYDLPSANLQHLLGLGRLVPKILRTCGNKLQYLCLTRIRIYPNTPIYEIALKDGQITEKTDLLPPVYYTSRSSKIQQYYASLLGQLIWNQTRKTVST